MRTIIDDMLEVYINQKVYDKVREICFDLADAINDRISRMTLSKHNEESFKKLVEDMLKGRKRK